MAIGFKVIVCHLLQMVCSHYAKGMSKPVLLKVKFTLKSQMFESAFRIRFTSPTLLILKSNPGTATGSFVKKTL